MTSLVRFEKIVAEGKALGYLDGRACFALGALPGELAEVRLVKDKPSFAEAAVVRIVEASDRRTGETEDHYLACSPWQGVDYAYQLELKRTMLTEIFARPELALPVADLIGVSQPLRYRNKLEFSLAGDSLAFHARNSQTELIGLPHGCRLGSDAMNAAAQRVLERLKDMAILPYVETLTVRQSQWRGGILVLVATRDAPKRDFGQLGKAADLGLAGLVVSRLQGRNTHYPVWQSGADSLVEDVAGVELSYPFDGFFQTNVPMFARALTMILEQVPAGAKLVDLYGGVGTIGLPAARIAADVLGVEINPSSVEQAAANAQRNGLTNYRAVATPAERLDPALLEGADCVVVDPPRAGLHVRVVRALLAAAPERIIYLSCNPVTQARDLMLLGEQYAAGNVTGFDFYPGTVHLESLVVLNRR